MENDMKKPRRKSKTFPVQFMQLFMQVANTGKPVVINTLENRRAAYTTLRARMSEFRHAFLYEAQEENDTAKKHLADSLYAVTIQNPECIDGVWQCIIKSRDGDVGDKLDELINPSWATTPAAAKRAEPESKDEDKPSYGAMAIDELFNKPDTE